MRVPMMRTSLGPIFSSVFLSLCFCAVSCGGHPQVIISDGDTLPGTIGAIINLVGLVTERGIDPDISGDNVVFGALTNSGNGFFALIDGELRVVVDTDTMIPGTQIPFSLFLLDGASASISGSNVAFSASGNNLPEGVWIWRNGSLELIADDSETPVPGRPGLRFGGFGQNYGAHPSISGENVVFNAVDENVDGGIYAYINGELRMIADTNTVLPGASGPASSFGLFGGVSPDISGENVVFSASWGTGSNGIYVYIDGEIRVIADTNTRIPGGVGVFPSVGSGASPAISGENVVFLIITGVYAYIDGVLRLVADNDTEVPFPATGEFGGFGGFAGSGPDISGENVVFMATAVGLGSGTGVFRYINGELSIASSTLDIVPDFPDMTFLEFGMFRGVTPAIDGTDIVFWGSSPSRIYRITDHPIPAVSAPALAVSALLLIALATVIITRRKRTA